MVEQLDPHCGGLKKAETWKEVKESAFREADLHRCDVCLNGTEIERIQIKIAQGSPRGTRIWKSRKFYLCQPHIEDLEEDLKSFIENFLQDYEEK